MSNEMTYRPDIDGLRALAVVPVVLYHAGFAFFSGGFIGVDVFFVISGYVISNSIIGMLNKGQFSIGEFYRRRIVRIFPALFAVLALSWIVGYFMLLPPSFLDYSKSVIASVLFYSNIYFWQSINYFNAAADLKPLLHTWSLSVEEQFYIFMPVAMYVIYKFFNKKWSLFIAPAIILSFSLSCFMLDKAPSANFYLLPTRAWELLLGAFVALCSIPKIERKQYRELFAVIGILCISVPIFLYDKLMPFPGYGALLPCLGAALIIWTGKDLPDADKTFVAKALSLKYVIFIGLISYSLYLVHWPVIVYIKYYRLGELNYLDSMLVLIISLLLAYLSWRYVEQPFRKIRTNVKPVILTGGVTILLVASVGLLGWNKNGFKERFPDFVEKESFEKITGKVGTCFFMNAKNYSKWNAEDCKVEGLQERNVLLWGDSFANHYMPGIKINKEYLDFNTYQYTSAGCPPILEYESYARPSCKNFNENALDMIDRLNIETVILSAKWTDYESRGLDKIKSTLVALDKKGVKYILIGQSPQYLVDVRLIEYLKGSDDNNDKWRVYFDPSINIKLRNIVINGVFLNPMEFLCSDDICQYEEDGEMLHSDYGHLSRKGSDLIVRKYLDVFNSIITVVK